MNEPNKKSVQTTPDVLINFGISEVNFKFIGKSAYISLKDSSLDIGHSMTQEEIFNILNGMDEYTTNEKNPATLITYEKWDDKTNFYTATVGKFMKSNTPVPDGMECFDIVSTVGKGWFKTKPQNNEFSWDDYLFDGANMDLVKEAITQKGYKETSWMWHVDVLPMGYPTSVYTDDEGYAYYAICISCEKND